MDWSSFLSIILLLFGEANRANAECVDTDLDSRGMMKMFVGTGPMAIIQCQNILTDHFSNAMRLLLVDCDDPDPVDSTLSCLKSSSTLEYCDSDAPVPSESFLTGGVNANISGVVKNIGAAFQCQGDKKFLSGANVALVQCFDGTWANFDDSCQTACSLPRDCSQIFEMGLDSDDQFFVIPSGNATGNGTKVWCELDPETEGGEGWTTVLHQVRSTLPSLTTEDCEYGFGDSKQTWETYASYFIGIKHLQAMNEELAIQFLMNDTSGNFYHASYFKVSITDIDYKPEIQSQYHGNAGDAFRDHQSQAWSCSIEGFGWEPLPGTLGLKISLGELSWRGMELHSLHIRVRPTVFDRASSCQTKFGLEDDGSGTEFIDFTLDRRNGTSFGYRCTRDLYTLIPNEGQVTCVDGYWDIKPDFPCKYYGPYGFVRRSSGSGSVGTFNDSVPGGQPEAALMCSQHGGSLAMVRSLEDLQNAIPDQYYHTGHVYRNGSIIPPLIDNLTCTENCEPDDYHNCITVNSAGNYNATGCFDELPYLCEYPGECPDGYTMHRGLCYKIINASEKKIDTLMECNSEGSSLAYPESIEDLEFFAELFENTVGPATPDSHVLLGLQNMYGALSDWYYLFNPDASLRNLTLETTSENETFFFLTAKGNANFDLTALVEYAGTVPYAICQYYGPMGCTYDPPELRENMEHDWDGINRTIGTVVNYTCGPFYNVMDFPEVTSQVSICYGQVGSWTGLRDCVVGNVCIEDFPVPQDGINMTTDLYSRKPEGVVTYTCPLGKGIFDGNTTQEVRCLGETIYNYSFTPSFVLPCNACMDALEVANATTAWENATIYLTGDLVQSTCLEGYRVALEASDFEVECTETGWMILDECYPACMQPPPLPGMNVSQSGYTSDARGTAVTYDCNPGLYLPPTAENPDYVNTITVTCETDATQNLWLPETSSPVDCRIYCLSDPPTPVGLMTSTFNEAERALDSEFTYDCPTGLVFGNLSSSLVVRCEGDGQWTPIDPAIFECKKLAPSPPPPVPYQAVSNASLDETFFVGSVITYSCSEDQMSPLGVRHFTIMCMSTGWVPPLDPQFVCLNICTTEPPPTPFTTHNLTDADTPYWGTVVQYLPSDGYLFDDYTTEKLTECVDGVWTPSFLPRARNDLPPLPAPPGPSGINLTITPPPYEIGSDVNYTCPDHMRLPDGKQYLTITRTETGWTTPDPSYECLNVCLDEPHYVYGEMTYNYTGLATWGTPVEYKCKGAAYFHGGATSVINYCQEGGTWSLFYIPFCVDPNAPPPPTTTETPLEMFDKNVFDEAYEITSDNHMPSIENFMGTVNGPEYVLTDGPFGFGYAIRLNTPEQCMKRSPYATPDDCTSDPKTCTKGFTIGIWERVNISFNVFYTVHKYPEDRKRYIFSTGGDEFGHPGIALYHQGLAIIGLVSTGDEYWQVDVLGNFDVNEWYHIALRFIASVGLEMFKDGKKVGHCHMSKNSAPRLALLNPSELLVGCHRDADNTNYRDYNNADFDEFATWNRRLPDSELSYLRGGNEEKVENLSPEECAHMLSKTDLKDSKQADIAMNMLNAMADTIPVVEESDNTTDTVKYNGTVKPLDAAGLKLKGIADVIHEVTKPKVIRDTYTVEDLDTYFKVVETASKILDESYAEQWHAIEESGHRGARGVKEDMERYVDIIASRIPLDKKNPQPMSYIKTTDNIMVKIEKMSIKDFREIGGTYATPDYREDGMEDLYREWDLPFDKVKVPTDLFSDPRCQMHPVSIVTCFYDSYDDVQSSEVISDQITPEGGLELGSRVLRVNISIDKPLHRKGHPKYYECHFDPKKVDKARIRFNLENKLKMPQLRALSFHHNELQTPVKQRLCIWWNTVINGWDTAGCKVLDTTSLNTKCVCRHWGTVATLVEFVEEKYPPYESDTAKYVKLFLYIISDICLLIYILVVFLAGDLKDQFHISGAALSVSVIGGSTALLISDSENIQSDRHNCAAMGTLIQGFYLMSGGWVAMLGHAGFKAVSKGIITGRLKSYCLISSGIALAVVGVSYAFYIHDMGTDPRCFIAWDDNLKLILFFCPLMCFLCVGVFFACVIFFNIRHAKKLNKAIETDLSSFILGSTYVMIYYFIVWVVGILSYIHFDGEYLGCYPTFQILNSLVGVVILLSLGIHSLKFRRVLTAASKRRGEMLQKMKETANKAKPKALNKPKGNNAKAPPAKAPPPSKPSTNPPPTQPPANPPPPQAPPKPPTPAPPAKPPTPQPPADLCPPAENPSQQAADLLDL